MTNAELARYLARELFKAGSEANDKAHRIQFKGGRWPDNETSLGGFGEPMLADWFERTLEKAQASSAGAAHD